MAGLEPVLPWELGTAPADLGLTHRAPTWLDFRLAGKRHAGTLELKTQQNTVICDVGNETLNDSVRRETVALVLPGRCETVVYDPNR